MKTIIFAVVLGFSACDPLDAMDAPTASDAGVTVDTGTAVPDAQATATCPDTVFASAGQGLCGVIRTEPGVAYPCVSTCESPTGARVSPGCHATARMRSPFDRGTDDPNAIGGQVICGCGEFCR